MYKLILFIALTVLLLPAADARSSSKRSPSTRSAAKSRSAPKSSKRCASCARDSRGRIARSSAAKCEFQKSHPCPATGKTTGPCRGYVVDHIVALKHGGVDEPGNMQWQTVVAAKAKDKVE